MRSGVQIKTRKRNIAVALDPGSFADAVVTIFEDARVDGDNLDQGLQGGVKARTRCCALRVSSAARTRLRQSAAPA